MKQSELDFLNNLRQASDYVAQHRGKVCVVYLPGELLEHREQLQEFAEDISHLNALGLRLIIVMGATLQINQALEQAGIDWSTHHQIRITSPDMLPVLQRTIGEVRSMLEAAFSRQQTHHPFPLTLCSGNWVIAKPRGVIDGVDYQHTGLIRKVNQTALQAVLDSNQIALLTPLAYSLTGEVFNLNTLEQACWVASKIHADKLMVFTSSDQMSGLPKQLSLNQLTHWPAQNADQADLIQCLANNAQEVKRIHLLNESDPTSLLIELFSRDGIGSLVFTDRYHQIRQARIEDVSGIIDLISPLEQKGMLVKRSRERLELEINQFFVIERDSHILGCAALYPHSNAQAELACLAIDPSYQGQGLGEELITHLVHKAKEQGIKQLFLLTTHTYHWFIEQGFVLANLDDLPPQKQQLYNFQRQSKVLIKALT